MLLAISSFLDFYILFLSLLGELGVELFLCFISDFDTSIQNGDESVSSSLDSWFYILYVIKESNSFTPEIPL